MNHLKISKKQADHITLSDLYPLTSDGNVQWRLCDPSGVYPTQSFRSLFKGRLYILWNYRLDVYNSKSDALIWFDKNASNLKNMILHIKATNF